MGKTRAIKGDHRALRGGDAEGLRAKYKRERVKPFRRDNSKQIASRL
jgi:hypothetical protein